jgi:hypothetical protein
MERFVYGFVVATDALWTLVGSGLDAQDLLRDVDNEFIDMFDDEFDSAPGHYAADIFAGRLDPQRAYPYTRLVEPILTMVAEPLGMIHMANTCYLPNDSFGRWNPVLAAIGLPRLAAVWASLNCPFPWPRGTTPRRDWPCVTELAPDDLTAVTIELEAGWRGALAALPDATVADGADPELAAATRAELTDDLDELTSWVDQARAPWSSRRRCVAADGNSLILVMDGGQ